MTDAQPLALAYLPYALRLATMFCKRYNLQGPVSEDIAAAAVLGLCAAASRFDAERGVRFETYSFDWIQGEMFGFVRREMRAKRASESSADDAVESCTDQPDGELRVLARELRHRVDALTAFERSVVVDQYSRGLTIAASARRLAKSKTHVVNTRRDALARLRRGWRQPPPPRI